MLRRVLVVVLLVAAMAGGGPTRAATEGDGTLVVRGNRTSYVDITLVRPTTEPIGARGHLHADFSSEGSYALYTLRPLGWKGPRAGGMMLRGWRDEAYPAYFSDTSDHAPLPPGTYRLYLITDGPTEFRITLPGYGDTIVAEPYAPFPATAEYIELGPAPSTRR